VYQTEGRTAARNCQKRVRYIPENSRLKSGRRTGLKSGLLHVLFIFLSVSASASSLWLSSASISDSLHCAIFSGSTYALEICNTRRVWWSVIRTVFTKALRKRLDNGSPSVCLSIALMYPDHLVRIF